MAGNQFLNPVVVSRTALGLLLQDLVLPRMVSRWAETDFTGGTGTTINVRRPPTLTGGAARSYGQTERDAGNEITLDRVQETWVPVTIGPMLYKGVPVTDEDFTFSLRDFGTQILDPLVRTVGISAEKVLADVVNAVTPAATFAADGADIHNTILDARTELNRLNVPMQGRVLAVSPEVEALLLKDAENRLVRYQDSGSTDALRAGTVGTLYGMPVVTTNSLAAGSLIIFVPEAFMFVMRAPAVPAGADWGGAVEYQGLAARVMRDYDARFMQDRCIVNTFVGAQVLDAQRAVRLVSA